MMNGTIFHIQRFSLYDGPGIRTTVFLKGCNLRCLWCHNPESQERGREVLFHRARCVGCGKCAGVCAHPFDLPACTACGKCVDVCFHDAREVCGREISADELFDEIVKDKDFYETSGGGVTFSGGEPLLQADFLCEMLKRCREAGISTAVETAANVPFSVIERVLPYLDLVICDVKAYSAEKHKRGTGVGNHVILANAAKLRDSGETDVLFRTPYIPGYNEDEIGAIASFVFPRKLELMPYHGMCGAKYASLGREFATKETVPPSADEMRKAVSQAENVFFTEHGI